MVLTRYQEIRDRVFELARRHDLRPDFPETTKLGRVLLLWSTDQIVVARTFLPTVSDPGPTTLRQLQYDLAGVFGEGWME